MGRWKEVDSHLTRTCVMLTHGSCEKELSKNFFVWNSFIFTYDVLSGAEI
jgi:hypothetical protein